MTGARGDTLTAEFEALEQAWGEALVRQDRAALERFLAPDYTLVVSATPDQPVARDTWLAQAEGPYRIEHFRIERLRARLLADGLVAVSLLFEQRATVGGVDRSGVFFLTDIWRRGGANWEVVARYSAHPEPASASSRAVTDG
jgi:hypothetical protein